MTRTVLFDGESALRSKKAQKEIADKLNITVHAEAYFKRSLAERAIREIKTCMTIHLKLLGMPLH